MFVFSSRECIIECVFPTRSKCRIDCDSFARIILISVRKQFPRRYSYRVGFADKHSTPGSSGLVGGKLEMLEMERGAGAGSFLRPFN